MARILPRWGSAESTSIFNNRNFMVLWAAQFLTQTAQQAIWFGMIVVVEQVSQSSVHLSAALLSTIIPGILLGLIAGVVVDRSNKKTVLVGANFLRAGVVLGYLLYTRSLYAVYAVNFAFVGISQFFGPAESSTIPALVPKRHLVAANSMFNLTFTISQMVGIVLLAPWVIKFFGAPALFIVVALIYLVGGVLTTLLPPGQPPGRPLTSLGSQMLLRTATDELGEAWRFITKDRQSRWSMIFITMGSTLMLILAMIVPRYVVVVVGIQPEDAVYLIAPAGLGILTMTLVLTRLARRYGEINLAYTGGLISGLAVGAMALLPTFAPNLRTLTTTITNNPDLLPGQQALVPPLMLVSAALGIGVALAGIPSQSLLMERAPVDSRGRIFSALLLLGNVAAIVPLAFLGALADLYGVVAVVGLVGATVLVITLAGVRDLEARRELSAP